MRFPGWNDSKLTFHQIVYQEPSCSNLIKFLVRVKRSAHTHNTNLLCSEHSDYNKRTQNRSFSNKISLIVHKCCTRPFIKTNIIQDLCSVSIFGSVTVNMKKKRATEWLLNLNSHKVEIQLKTNFMHAWSIVAPH